MKTPGSDSATILLVDDEEAVQKLLTYPLEQEGFRVLQARDGEEALRRFEAEQVDLVVLDLMLPRLDGLAIDLSRRLVELKGRRIDLTYVEFELLRALVAKPGRVFSRQALLQGLWGDYAYREPRTIDVHIRHLREKLGDPELIQTVRGVGYRARA